MFRYIPHEMLFGLFEGNPASGKPGLQGCPTNHKEYITYNTKGFKIHIQIIDAYAKEVEHHVNR